MAVPFPRNNVSLKIFECIVIISLQYPSLFFQCISMVIFLYTQPYISTAANVAEAILSISTTAMLLQSVQPTMFEITTILLSDTNSTCSDENSIITFNTWILATLFYLPLAVTTFFIVRSLVKFIR